MRTERQQFPHVNKAARDLPVGWLVPILPVTVIGQGQSGGKPPHSKRSWTVEKREAGCYPQNDSATRPAQPDCCDPKEDQ
jgi:hypothetical protein